MKSHGVATSEVLINSSNHDASLKTIHGNSEKTWETRQKLKPIPEHWNS